jgi:hypothetical protein
VRRKRFLTLLFEDQRLQARDAISHALFKEDFEDEIYRD